MYALLPLNTTLSMLLHVTLLEQLSFDYKQMKQKGEWTSTYAKRKDPEHNTESNAPRATMHRWLALCISTGIELLADEWKTAQHLEL